jgi:hypothetical protein
VPYGESPLSSNRIATNVLLDLAGAGSETDSGQPIFRLADAEGCLRELLQGSDDDFSLWLAAPSAPFEHFVQKLKLPTERHVIEGLGWQEYVRFCSPATGRTFCIRRSLEPGLPDARPVFDCDADDTPVSRLIDLVETLAIDASDLAWIHEDINVAALPTWALWRQDDNGNKAHVETFTGYRKARAALGRFEALGHKQMYWLERRETGR